MVRKKAGGYIFEGYKGDHPPLHVHVSDDRGYIGRWDIENQRPMDFELTGDLRKALIKVGYMKETQR